MAGREHWAELVLPLPCLWDPLDPNFSNEAVKAVCREQLLAKCNQQASTPVDMESLKQWLAGIVIVKRQPQPKLEDLALEYPCLWNPKDRNYRNSSLRERCWRQLLEKFNSFVNDPITMSDLRRKLASLHSRLRRQHTESKLEDLALRYPCLWNPKDRNYRNYSLRERCRQHLLEKFNSVATKQIAMPDLRRKLSLLNNRLRKQYTETATETPLPETGSPRDGQSEPEKVDRNDAKKGKKKTSKKRKNKLNKKKLQSVKEGCKEPTPAALPVPSTDTVGEDVTPPAVGATDPMQHGDPTPDKVGDLPQETNATDPMQHVHTTSEKVGVLPQETEDCTPREVEETTCAPPVDDLPAAPETSTDSTEPLTNRGLNGPAIQPILPTVVISVTFSWCRVCGELKNDCVDTTNIPKPYINNKKCILIVNELIMQMDFTHETLPKTICGDCDKKILDMHAFVKRMQHTEATFHTLERRKRRTEDVVVVNDKEYEKEVQKKKVKITIDFNSDTFPSLSDENDCIEIDDDEIDLMSVSDSEVEITGEENNVRGCSLLVTNANEEFERSRSGVPVSIISQSPCVNGNKWAVLGPISQTCSDFNDDVSEQIKCEDSIDITDHSPSIADNNDIEINSGNEIDSTTVTNTFVKEVAEQRDKSKVTVDGNSSDILYRVNGIEIKRLDTLDPPLAETALAKKVPEQTDLSSRSLPVDDDDHDETNPIASKFTHETNSNLVTTENNTNEVTEERKERVVSDDISTQSSLSCNGVDDNSAETSQVQETCPRNVATYTDFVKTVVFQAANSTGLSIDSGTLKDIKCEDNLMIVGIKKDEDAIYIFTDKTVTSNDAKCEDNETVVDIKKEIADDIDDVR